MSYVPSSLRERKKKATRQALKEAATERFLRNGFDATTVTEIAEAASVSQRTFFRYFPTKEAIVFSSHETRLGLFRELLEQQAVAENPLQQILRALIGLAQAYQSWKAELMDEWNIVVRSPFLVARDVELDYEFESAIAAVLATNEHVPPGMAPIYAGAAFGAVRAVMREWFLGDCQLDLVELGSQRLEALFGVLPATQR